RVGAGQGIVWTSGTLAGHREMAVPKHAVQGSPAGGRRGHVFFPDQKRVAQAVGDLSEGNAVHGAEGAVLRNYRRVGKDVIEVEPRRAAAGSKVADRAGKMQSALRENR